MKILSTDTWPMVNHNASWTFYLKLANLVIPSTNSVNSIERFISLPRQANTQLAYRALGDERLDETRTTSPPRSITRGQPPRYVCRIGTYPTVIIQRCPGTGYHRGTLPTTFARGHVPFTDSSHHPREHSNCTLLQLAG